MMLTVLLSCGLCVAEEWPQWRGPNRDGIWSETGIVDKFDCPELEVKWRAPIANGYTGPSIADGRIYLSDRIKEPVKAERVLCFDAESGKEIWSHTYECSYRKLGYPDGPRASVTIDDGRAYSLGAMGHLFCFDAATGAVIWSKDPNKDYRVKLPIWGIAAAPLIYENLIVVQIGGTENACIVAFDKKSGTEEWQALPDKASYSALMLTTQASKDVLVCLTGERLVGLNPRTGELYWQHPFKSIQSIAAPVIYDDYVFVSTFFDGSMLVILDKDKLTSDVVWKRKGQNEKKTDSLHCCISTGFIEGDYIYGIDSYGELRCLELRTGDRVWESLDVVPQARWANVHMVRNQGKVWMFNERGELIISRLSPKGFTQISSLSSRQWAN
ncbi:MAG: PQQ-binding-like beta-propeller repeat protein [Planctomycetota bacterium]|jgi:outer membrane protein assembly factor BamB